MEFHRKILRRCKTKFMSMLWQNIRGVFGKYVDKCNRMRIKYTRHMKFCINEYQLLNIKYSQFEKPTPIYDLDISH